MFRQRTPARKIKELRKELRQELRGSSVKITPVAHETGENNLLSSLTFRCVGPRRGDKNFLVVNKVATTGEAEHQEGLWLLTDARPCCGTPYYRAVMEEREGQVKAAVRSTRDVTPKDEKFCEVCQKLTSEDWKSGARFQPMVTTTEELHSTDELIMRALTPPQGLHSTETSDVHNGFQAARIFEDAVFPLLLEESEGERSIKPWFALPD